LWTFRELHYPPPASGCLARKSWPFTLIAPSIAPQVCEQFRQRLLNEVRQRRGLPPLGLMALPGPIPTVNGETAVDRT
jgi:hypothetical protein